MLSKIKRPHGLRKCWDWSRLQLQTGLDFGGCLMFPDTVHVSFSFIPLDVSLHGVLASDLPQLDHGSLDIEYVGARQSSTRMVSHTVASILYLQHECSTRGNVHQHRSVRAGFTGRIQGRTCWTKAISRYKG